MSSTIDWQMLMALAIVATAVAHLGHRAWQLFAARGQASCGGCGTCAAVEAKAGDGFVAVEKLRAEKP